MKPPFPASKQLNVAIQAANRAGQIIEDYFRNGFKTSAKSKAGVNEGLVTQADLAAEQVIIQIIQDSFPEHSIMAEESEHSPSKSEHLWVIDPLDGTNNFAHQIPHFAVSIGYQHGEHSRNEPAQ